MKPQAIAGVSAGTEREIETVYPSIAAGGIGRLIGTICDAIPVRIGGVKLSAVFALPLVPLAMIPFSIDLVFGRRFTLTNRSIRVKSSLGDTLHREISLNEIDEIAVDVQSGQAFYRAGNLVLLKANGDEIATLAGIVRPERFRHVILDVRDARQLSDSSLATIQARQPQPA